LITLYKLELLLDIREKVESYDEYLYTVIREPVPTYGSINGININILVFSHVVLTFHYGNAAAIVQVTFPRFSRFPKHFRRYINFDIAKIML
jgi:Mg2+ and Co2+ transporter CorA